MTRFILYLVILILVTRALSRLWSGIAAGMRGEPRSGGVPQSGVAMVRDPVCGTFVLPDRSLHLSAGGRSIYFCSPDCRAKYQAAHR